MITRTETHNVTWKNIPIGLYDNEVTVTWKFLGIPIYSTTNVTEHGGKTNLKVEELKKWGEAAGMQVPRIGFGGD